MSARGRHRRMIGDRLRTEPLLGAVAMCVRPGSIVLDIGTGLGILAVAAAKAGAARVWACDLDEEALGEAELAARREGVADRIEFIRRLSYDLKLPKRADIAICEAVGSFAFDENILAAVKDARRRLLKRGARIIPERVELWGAPIGRAPRMMRPADIARVREADLLIPPARIASVNLMKDAPAALSARWSFGLGKAGEVRAIAVWPRVTWAGNLRTDASPLAPPTHWKQGILPLEARRMGRGEWAEVEIIIRPHPSDPRTMTERLWRWADRR